MKNFVQVLNGDGSGYIVPLQSIGGVVEVGVLQPCLCWALEIKTGNEVQQR